jgi:hypothetical protein
MLRRALLPIASVAQTMGNCYAVHMNCLSRVLTFALFGALMLTLVQAPVARAQNDKDLDRLITSMYDDAKKFRSSFNPSISKSTIRKTSQEKQSKRLVDQFVSDVAAMRSQYRKKKTVDATFPRVQTAAVQIDDLLHSVHLDDATNAAWAKVRAEFQQVSEAFHIPSPLK